MKSAPTLTAKTMGKGTADRVASARRAHHQAAVDKLRDLRVRLGEIDPPTSPKEPAMPTTTTRKPRAAKAPKTQPVPGINVPGTVPAGYGSDEPDAQTIADVIDAESTIADIPADIPADPPAETTPADVPKHITPADGQTDMVCRSCGVEKKLSQFPTVNHPVGNRGTQCRACRDAARTPRS